MSEGKEEQEKENDFGYMEELSRAYEAAFAKRIAKRYPLPEEKRDLLLSLQGEIRLAAEGLLRSRLSEECREMALMLKESAEECITLLCPQRQAGSSEHPISLPRAVLCANRSLNLLIRHREEHSRAVILILSELSVLYALAAIG